MGSPSPLISEGARRAIKVGSWALCTVVGYEMVFRTDYGEHDHCFRGAQEWHRKRVHQLFGIDSTPSHTVSKNRSDAGRTLENEREEADAYWTSRNAITDLGGEGIFSSAFREYKDGRKRKDAPMPGPKEGEEGGSP